MSDPFLKMAKATQDKKIDEYKDALLWAHSEAHTDSGRDFVRSCQEFFNKTGRLTEKQVRALYNIDTNYDDYNDSCDATDSDIY